MGGGGAGGECFRFHSSGHVGEWSISVSWSLTNQGRGCWLFSFNSSEQVSERNISVSWYLYHGGRGTLLFLPFY